MNTLPVLSIQVEGKILANNSAEFVEQAKAFVSEINFEPDNDDDFGAATETIAECKKIEASIDQAIKDAQFPEVAKMIEIVQEAQKIVADARKKLTKIVDDKKASKKDAAIGAAVSRVNAHMIVAERSISPIKLAGHIALPIIADAAKNKKTEQGVIDGVNSVADTSIKIIDENAAQIREKLDWCKEHAANKSFLFPDLQTLIFRDKAIFEETIIGRIEKHNTDQELLIVKQENEEKQRAAQKAKQERVVDNVDPGKQSGGDQTQTVQAIDIHPVAKPDKPVRDVSIPAQSKVGQGITTISARNIGTVKTKPTDLQIVQGIADHFRISLPTAIEWLLDVDMEAMSDTLLELM